MAGSHNTESDPESLEKAQTLWKDFTEWMKYGVIAVIAVLILMAIFLL